MLKLREVQRSDLEFMRNLRNENMPMLRTPYYITEKMQEDYYDNVISDRNSLVRYYIIEDEVSPCGIGGFVPISWENRSAEISLIMNWGNGGKGNEAFLLLLDEAFNRLNLETVYGECYHCNPKGKFWGKMVEKYEGIGVDIYNKRKYSNGQYWGSYYFTFFKEKFSDCNSV